MLQGTENQSDPKSEFSSSSSESQRRPRGRPKGSKTRRQFVVDVPLPQCGKCKSTDMLVDRTKRTLQHIGTHDGKPYTRITWQRVKCRQCGWVQIHKLWHNDAEVDRLD